MLTKGEWASTLIGHTSMLNYAGMAACGFFRNMIQKVLGSFPEVSHDSTKPMKMIIALGNTDCVCLKNVNLSLNLTRSYWKTTFYE